MCYYEMDEHPRYYDWPGKDAEYDDLYADRDEWLWERADAEYDYSMEDNDA